MRPAKVAAIAGGIVLMAISGCSRSGSSTIKIDGHVFYVPKDYLVQGTIPWLPASQSEGLKFIINPRSRPEEQIMVTIESTAATCHPKSPPASSQLFSACSAASQADVSGDVMKDFVIEKVHRDKDPTQWEYRLKDQGTVVASCYTLSDDGKTGLCTSLSHYKNLVYSVSLRDSDVKHLPSIREKVTGMLTSWEKRASSE